MKILKTLLSWVLPLVILGAAIGGFVVLGGPKPPPRKDKEPPKAVMVQTRPIEPQSTGIDLEVDGTIAGGLLTASRIKFR